jgi:hypothetical protein
MSKRVEDLAVNAVPKVSAHAMQGTTLLVMALAMSACSKAPSAPPLPVTSGPPVESSPARVGGSDSSVPEASSVVVPSAGPKLDATAGRTNGTMTRAEESSAMPMPGQNNDHSAPIGPAKRASSP